MRSQMAWYSRTLFEGKRIGKKLFLDLKCLDFLFLLVSYSSAIVTVYRPPSLNPNGLAFPAPQPTNPLLSNQDLYLG